MLFDEWVKGNQFNSFNSWKGLLYREWYEAIVKGEFLPPVEASLDPIHRCNLHCKHCNAHRYLREGDTTQRMTDDHLLNLVEFLGNWGVRAVCFGGGGEPTLHTNLANAIIMATSKGMKSSIATNGTQFNSELLGILQLVRWVGVSLDAGTRETYRALKGIQKFEGVLENVRQAVRLAGDHCDFAIKFLISEVNQREIFEACKIAKDLGVRDFHARPADYSHQGMGELSDKIGNIDIGHITEQFNQCRTLEDKDFRVFTVVHKFDEQFRPVKRFTQCYAAPLTIQLCADGNVYFCVDQRHRTKYILGKHTPNPNKILDFWGGKEHKELVFCDTPYDCHTRCTYGVYNEQCEQLFAQANKDPMCWEFP